MYESPPPPGVCVFDIDGTLKSYGCSRNEREQGKENARYLVQTCVDNGFALGVNTARLKLHSRIKDYLADVGLDVRSLPPDAVQTKAFTSNKKAKAMARISDAYGGVAPHNMIFFDDRKRNVQAVRANGYHGVHVQGMRDGYGCLVVSDQEQRDGEAYFQHHGYAQRYY
jgi:beta-phosphoglucomutase-like phosphatase (HAD superfamily)